ncbi:hypothetical protein AZI85_14575 [Bdellovibrio bacteriovorus]|uniref:Uncharacterized protein n=1 Tax=Bdellovibrio bacteriovorus TaxID=959 RepID=A0A150WV75_BDEBC|nr:hypothetical protein [Bdellovibrio bacteriovorus]KYG70353.1 hypothetical protein AZI85_14575 [Bdellovibrio bacteriovorus]
MKSILFASFFFFVLSAGAADTDSLKSQSSKLMAQGKAKAQEVMTACKEDKVKHCDKYTEMEALKTCLAKNKESLTPSCRTSLGM